MYLQNPLYIGALQAPLSRSLRSPLSVGALESPQRLFPIGAFGSTTFVCRRKDQIVSYLYVCVHKAPRDLSCHFQIGAL